MPGGSMGQFPALLSLTTIRLASLGGELEPPSPSTIFFCLADVEISPQVKLTQDMQHQKEVGIQKTPKSSEELWLDIAYEDQHGPLLGCDAQCFPAALACSQPRQELFDIKDPNVGELRSNTMQIRSTIVSATNTTPRRNHYQYNLITILFGRCPGGSSQTFLREPQQQCHWSLFQ